jgi:two-component system LytT family sensor kinase
MVFRNLILSKEKKYVAFRHLLFWILYGTLFHIQNNNRTLLYLICFLPACVTIVYALLYAVLPLIQNKRYALAVSAGTMAYVTSLLLNFIGSYLFFQTWEDEVPNRMIAGLALHNHILALCMGGVAFGLKAMKSWYLKQIENLALAKLKAQNELKLEKANLYPEFILQALTSLLDKVVKRTIDSPDLLLKLSDTLSYILYDSQVELIQLEKELIMVRNIVMFRAMQWSSCNIQFVTGGISTDRYVAPLAVFRMVENIFRVVGVETEVPTDVDMRIGIEDEYLNVSVVIQYSLDRHDRPGFESIVRKMKKHIEDTYNHHGEAFEMGRGQCSVSVTLPISRQIAYVNDIQTKENVLA